MPSTRPLLLALAMIPMLATGAKGAELRPLAEAICPTTLPPYASAQAEQAASAELSLVLKRCIAVYRLHYALQQQGQGATADPTT